MPSDYEYDLPSFSDDSWTSSSSFDLSDYNLTDTGDESAIPSAAEYRKDDDWSTGWFVDSTKGTPQGEETTMFDGVWKWLTSSQGASTAASAIDAMMKMWAANKAEENKDPTEAMLKDARIKAHNESINQPWVPAVRELRR